MNIFFLDTDTKQCAKYHCDKHVVKMPLESCQMLSIIFSKWYYDWGTINKMDGTPYNTQKGAFRNHPCTAWAGQNIYNTAWLIMHGNALAFEYYLRYGKIHSCSKTLFEAKKLFHKKTGEPITCYSMAEGFARAMPEEYKFDTSISTFDAYKMYIASKPWVKDNYLRMPQRKPDWI